MKKTILILLLLLQGLFAAVGCDLNDPDRDILRLGTYFTSIGPAITYKTTYLSLDRLGGEKLLQEVEERLGDKFSGLYETIDVPYTVYTLYQKDKIIGYIHGINQKGRYGGLQVFLVYDTQGTVKNFYYQKLTNKKAKELRSVEFADQFQGINLQNYAEKIKIIKNPDLEDDTDFKATLRAVKKNLILMDIFIFNRKDL